MVIVHSELLVYQRGFEFEASFEAIVEKLSTDIGELVVISFTLTSDEQLSHTATVFVCSLWHPHIFSESSLCFHSSAWALVPIFHLCPTHLGESTPESPPGCLSEGARNQRRGGEEDGDGEVVRRGHQGKIPWKLDLQLIDYPILRLK